MLSIIFLSFESSSLIRQSIQRTVEVFESEDIEFEIIVVDDGSKDDSFLIAKEIAAADKRIRPFQLSKNYGSPAAFFAGLSLAKGACATSIPDDLQRPPELLVELYRTWQRGNTPGGASSSYIGLKSDMHDHTIMNTIPEGTGFGPRGMLYRQLKGVISVVGPCHGILCTPVACTPRWHSRLARRPCCIIAR